MATTLSRRSVLAAGAGAAAGILLPGASALAAGRPTAATTVGFRLDAEVLDGSEQVTSVTLDTSRLGPIDPASLTTTTFTVHAKATSPIPIDPGDLIFTEYDLDRPVTAARLDRAGNIVLDLRYGEDVVGGGTIGYILGKGRDVQLDLDYTITQNAPFRLRDRQPVTISRFRQGRLSDPEVDVWSRHLSRGGLKYRLYSPRGGRGARPLIVWLHGGGEGASLPDGYYDNESQLRGNRGALGFATPEAQRIFGGAYVVAPQSTSFWMEDGDRFSPLIKQIVDDLARRYPIDRSRIYVAGCSNGGYLSVKLTTVYPDLFAASVPICSIVDNLDPAGAPLVPDAQLRRISTPTWLVASRDDGTVPPEENTIHAHDLIPRSLITLYDDVTWNGHRFDGHWSWIYVAHNQPSVRGTHIWQWMAQQRRR